MRCCWPSSSPASAARGWSITTASRPSLANIYGDDATSPAVCGDTAVLAEEAAAANGDIDALVAIEDRLGFATPLPGGQCTRHLRLRGRELSTYKDIFIFALEGGRG